MTQVENALRKVFSWFSLDRLEALRDAFAENRVIRKVYVDLQEKRCIMSHLDNDITSRLKLQERFPNTLDYVTTRVVIENWDAGVLTKEKAEAVLAETIAERIAAERAMPSETIGQTASARSRERACAV